MFINGLLYKVRQETRRRDRIRAAHHIAAGIGVVVAASACVAAGVFMTSRTGKEMREKMKYRAMNTVDSLKDSVIKNVDVVRDSAAQTADKVNHVIETAYDKAEDIKKELWDSGNEIKKDVNETAENIAKSFEEQITSQSEY